MTGKDGGIQKPLTFKSLNSSWKTAGMRNASRNWIASEATSEYK
jgi:hypothetical protein